MIRFNQRAGAPLPDGIVGILKPGDSIALRDHQSAMMIWTHGQFKVVFATPDPGGWDSCFGETLSGAIGEYLAMRWSAR